MDGPVGRPARLKSAPATNLRDRSRTSTSKVIDRSIPMTISFRTAHGRDAETISALAVQVFLDAYATDGVRPDLAAEAFGEYGEARFRERLDETGRRFVLAENDGALVGFAEVLTDSRPPVSLPGPASELVRLYVQPAAQRRGIGRSLIARAEDAAGEASSAVLWLAAWEDNAKALRFYARVGYTDVGEAAYRIQGRSYRNRVLARPLREERDAVA